MKTECFSESYARMRFAIDTMEAADRFSFAYHADKGALPAGIAEVYHAARGVLFREWSIPNPERE